MIGEQERGNKPERSPYFDVNVRRAAPSVYPPNGTWARMEPNAVNSDPNGHPDGHANPAYECKYCKKTFARAEHLSRHERSRISLDLVCHVNDCRHVGATICLSAMQACVFEKVLSVGDLADGRDVLARHKRLVHTRPEDREPPKKRGRPPKSSYANAKNDANKTTPSTVTQNGTPAAQNVAEPVFAAQDTQFPYTNGDSQTQSFLTNPFMDNFMFGSLDNTLSEINFAEQDILSFLKPDSTRYGRPPSLNSLNSLNGNTVNPDTKPVILQPDFVDWLQMNRDDYTFSMHHSSPRGLEGVSTSPAPDLIEATDSKDIPLVNPAKPFTLVLIDEQTYAGISTSLKTTYKVREPLYLFNFRTPLPPILFSPLDELWNDSFPCSLTAFILISQSFISPPSTPGKQESPFSCPSAPSEPHIAWSETRQRRCGTSLGELSMSWLRQIA